MLILREIYKVYIGPFPYLKLIENNFMILEGIKKSKSASIKLFMTGNLINSLVIMKWSK